MIKKRFINNFGIVGFAFGVVSLFLGLISFDTYEAGGISIFILYVYNFFFNIFIYPAYIVTSLVQKLPDFLFFPITTLLYIVLPPVEGYFLGAGIGWLINKLVERQIIWQK